MKSLNFFLRAIAVCLVLGGIPILTVAQTTKIDLASTTGGAGAGRSNVLAMSGLIGLLREEAVGLNFTNVDNQVSLVHLYFVDAKGNTLKSSTERVSPGQSVGLVLAGSEVGDPTATRIQVRAAVVVDPPEPDVDPPDPDLAISSLEVFDQATGKTNIGLPLIAVRKAGGSWAVPR